MRLPSVPLSVVVLLVSAALAACDLGGGGGSGGGNGRASRRLAVRDTGARSLDYLTDADFDALAVEVDYLEGPPLEPERNRPDDLALDFLVDRLARRIRKPAGIAVAVDDRIPRAAASSGGYGLRDLAALEALHRDARTGDTPGVAHLYILYLDGPFADDPFLLGLNTSATSFAILKETLRGLASLPEDRRRAEKMLLLHEAGHVLGLVHITTPMASGRHEDRKHAFHDESDRCVMFHEIETGLVGSLGDPPLELDRACRLDLEAAGGLPAGP